MQRSRFYLKNGDLSLYSLACGYLQQFSAGERMVELSLDGCYHVKTYKEEKEHRSRLTWDCFDTLGEARKVYSSIKRSFKA